MVLAFERDSDPMKRGQIRAIVPQLAFVSLRTICETSYNSWESEVTTRWMLARKLKLQNRYSGSDQSVRTGNAITNGEALTVNQCG